MNDVNVAPTAAEAGLIAFLDVAIENGYLKTATGQSTNSATKELLSTTQPAASWETVDLASLDEADVLRRFETLTAMKFSPGSLSTYKSRYSRAVTMLEDFRASPANWQPSIKQQSRSKASDAATSAAPESAQGATPTSSTPSGRSVPHPGRGSATITYPFPLRQAVLASVELPPNRTRREAQRLTAFTQSMATEDEVAEPSNLPPESPHDHRD